MTLELTPDNKLKKLIVVGDRVLVRPRQAEERTKSGLILPPTVKEKEEIQTGYIMKAGPGYPIPLPTDPADDEPWREQEEKVRYIPLQAREGDLAIFVLKGATEVQYEGEKYFILPQSSILMLEREF